MASVAACFVTAGWQLIVCSAAAGFFIGADYPIATSLIAEFTPRKERRESAHGHVSDAWYLGATAAAFVGFALYSVDGGWRWMSAAQWCRAWLMVLLIGRHDIPESPRWLAQRGQVEKAREVMATVFGGEIELDDEQPVRAGFASVFRQGATSAG